MSGLTFSIILAISFLYITFNMLDYVLSIESLWDSYQKGGAEEPTQWLRILAAVVGDWSLFPAPTLNGLQSLVTSALKVPKSYFGFNKHLHAHSCALIHTYIHINKKKSQRGVWKRHTPPFYFTV